MEFFAWVDSHMTDHYQLVSNRDPSERKKIQKYNLYSSPWTCNLQKKKKLPFTSADD